jgi:thiol-disulfide isomerase/thioredoxin
MKSGRHLLLLLLTGLALCAAEPLPIEAQVAEATKSSRVTVVHFWASWCSNCREELKGGGWREFIEANPETNVIFVMVRDEKSGAAELAQYSLGPQRNFQHLQHPNASRRKGEEMTSFMGLPVGWIPSTWIFRDGRLRFALNYGEIRFSILPQCWRSTSVRSTAAAESAGTCCKRRSPAHRRSNCTPCSAISSVTTSRACASLPPTVSPAGPTCPASPCSTVSSTI